VKAVLQLVVTLFTALPLQRALLVLALCLMPLPLIAHYPASVAFALLSCFMLLIGPAMMGGTARHLMHHMEKYR
jgi:hypothetical protein